MRSTDSELLTVHFLRLNVTGYSTSNGLSLPYWWNEDNEQNYLLELWRLNKSIQAERSKQSLLWPQAAAAAPTTIGTTAKHHLLEQPTSAAGWLTGVHSCRTAQLPVFKFLTSQVCLESSWLAQIHYLNKLTNSPQSSVLTFLCALGLPILTAHYLFGFLS